MNFKLAVGLYREGEEIQKTLAIELSNNILKPNSADKTVLWSRIIFMRFRSRLKISMCLRLRLLPYFFVTRKKSYNVVSQFFFKFFFIEMIVNKNK
jgi:hypothetical protein